jgi:hypothetical protein
MEYLSTNCGSVFSIRLPQVLPDVRGHPFRVFGGIPGCGVHGGMRTAITKVSRGGCEL